MNLVRMIFPTTALIMAAFAPTALAQQKLRGLQRDGGGVGGGVGGGRPEGTTGGERGGPFGGDNFPNVVFVDDICEGLTPTTCELPPRATMDGDANTDGIFVCRTRTNPNTQEVNTHSICIPDDKGIEGDDCGCCDPDACPVPGSFFADGGRPEGGPGGEGGFPFDNVVFVDDVCEGLTPTPCELPPRATADGAANTDGIFVCRTRTNPNTQDVNTRSICIPEDKGIEGDVCGCCDPDGCPEPGTYGGVGAGGGRFDAGGRPEGPPGNGGPGGRGPGGPFGAGILADVNFVDNICEEVAPTFCELPPRRFDAVDSDTNIDGIFVCRTRTNPRTQEVTTFSMCIPEDRGIAGDLCGCCDPNECPAPCGCPCDLLNRDGNPRVDEDGVSVTGALVTMEGMGNDMCVPRFASAVMVERSNGAVTCSPCA